MIDRREPTGDVTPVRFSPAAETGFGVPDDPPATVVARNLLFTAELKTIARAFELAALDFIVLKGVPLAHRIFGRLQGRRIRDNDILVRSRDVHRAIAVLHDCGYASLEPQPRDLRRVNQHSLIRRLPSGQHAPVELHWRAFYPVLFDVAEDIEWAHTETFRLDDLTLRVFDKPLTLLHLAAHFAQHAFSEAWILRDMAAAWNLWQLHVEPRELRALARETGTEYVLEFTLQAATDVNLLDVPAPRSMSRRVSLMRRLLPTRRLFEPRPSPDHRRRMLLFVVTGMRRVPGYIFNGMFPSLEWMSVTYGKPVSRWLYLRYATRPFRAIQRGMKRPARRDP